MTTAKIDKVIEECSELIQALCKVKRYGWFSYHPSNYHVTNMDNVQYEAQDVMEAFERLQEDMREISAEHYKGQ